MQLIPLNPIPGQTLNIVLGNQFCTINVYQKFYGLFCDLFVNASPIITGAICLNRAFIVRSLYLGFKGDLGFFDTQGTNDPVYTGLGSRFAFIYLELSDLSPTYGLST